MSQQSGNCSLGDLITSNTTSNGLWRNELAPSLEVGSNAL